MPDNGCSKSIIYNARVAKCHPKLKQLIINEYILKNFCYLLLELTIHNRKDIVSASLAPPHFHRDHVQRANQSEEMLDTVDHKAPAVMHVNVRINVANGLYKPISLPKAS